MPYHEEDVAADADAPEKDFLANLGYARTREHQESQDERETSERGFETGSDSVLKAVG